MLRSNFEKQAAIIEEEVQSPLPSIVFASGGRAPANNTPAASSSCIASVQTAFALPLSSASSSSSSLPATSCGVAGALTPSGAARSVSSYAANTLRSASSSTSTASAMLLLTELGSLRVRSEELLNEQLSLDSSSERPLPDQLHANFSDPQTYDFEASVTPSLAPQYNEDLGMVNISLSNSLPEAAFAATSLSSLIAVTSSTALSF